MTLWPYFVVRWVGRRAVATTRASRITTPFALAAGAAVDLGGLAVVHHGCAPLTSNHGAHMCRRALHSAPVVVGLIVCGLAALGAVIVNRASFLVSGVLCHARAPVNHTGVVCREFRGAHINRVVCDGVFRVASITIKTTTLKYRVRADMRGTAEVNVGVERAVDKHAPLAEREPPLESTPNEDAPISERLVANIPRTTRVDYPICHTKPL